MKTKTLLIIICILSSLNIFCQSDEDLIRHSIQNYFNGTSYNYLDQIKVAFHPDAELYLENREGELMKLTVDEYIAFFKKNTVGDFNGRYNKILSIDMEGNLALVKAEILLPSRNRRYIDVFIMKKISDDLWVILSKAANSSLIEKE